VEASPSNGDPSLRSPGAPESPTVERQGFTIGGAAALSLAASIGGMIFSLTRSKFTAVFLGPEGIGKTAEILQLVNLANVPIGMLTGPALQGALAEANAESDVTRAQRVINTATNATLALSLVGGAAAVLAGHFILPEPWGRDAWYLTALGAAAVAVGGVFGIVPKVFIAYGRLREATLSGIAAGGVGTVFACIAIPLWGLDGVFIALLASPIAMAVVYAAMAARSLPGLSFTLRPAFDTVFLRRATSVGVVSIVGALASQGALMAIRFALEHDGGPTAVGHFQASWAIGSMYFSVVLGSFGSFVFPRYAAARSVEELTREIDTATSFLFRLAPPVVFLAISFRGVVIHGLYSDRFDDAIPLLGIQMTGDLAKALAWAQAGPLLYRAKARAYLITESCASLALGLGSVLLIPHLGLMGVGYAYSAMYVGYAFLTAFVLRLACGVPLRPRGLASVVVLVAVSYGVLWATERWGMAKYLVGLACLAWLHRAGVIRDVLGWLKAKLAKR
jgi:O-antigen/teichoic acid export membrane protein